VDTFLAYIKLFGDFFVVPFLGVVFGLCALSPSLGDWIKMKDEAMKLSPWKWRVGGILIIAFFALYFVAGIKDRKIQSREQTLDYQQQVVVKHETEALADHFYRVAVIYDTNQEEQADFIAHDVKWLQAVTDELLKQDLESDKVVNIYNEAQQAGGIKGENIKRMADELNKLASKLPKND
jgi:hypothetical protein